MLNAGGSVRFRRWRLYGERGLAGKRATVWVDGETLTLGYAADTLARYRVAYEADGRGLQEVAELRLYATCHVSPQPFLPPLDEIERHPARRLAPYWPRCKRRENGGQGRLFPVDPQASAG